MDEFEARKRKIFQPIYVEAGAALVDCQYLEYSITYLLYLFARFQSHGIQVDRMRGILDGEEKKTAGQLIGLLKKHLKVSEGIEESLTSALKARNILIHNFFLENSERMIDVNEHDRIKKEINLLRKEVIKAIKQLEPFVNVLGNS